MIETRRQVRVEESMRWYVLDITRAIRNRAEIELGASPRTSLGLYQSSQAWAVIQGRDYVLPDDVKKMESEVLTHRLIISAQALQSETANGIFDFFSRGFNQLLSLLQILLLPVIEAFIFVAEKIMEFLSCIIEWESLAGIPDEVQVLPTLVFPFEQGESLLQIPLGS